MEYRKGSIVKEPRAKISEIQCDVGLHVFRIGERPEWHGLCEPDHELIPLRVRVKSEHICFAGIATMNAKLRVSELEVLD